MDKVQNPCCLMIRYAGDDKTPKHPKTMDYHNPLSSSIMDICLQLSTPRFDKHLSVPSVLSGQDGKAEQDGTAVEDI